MFKQSCPIFYSRLIYTHGQDIFDNNSMAVNNGTTLERALKINPFYKVSYYIKWVTTSWTHSIHSVAAAVPCVQEVLSNFILPIQKWTRLLGHAV